MKTQPKPRSPKRRRESKTSPFDFEDLLRKKGFLAIAGVDEAGRGPLAGPVVAAAVILPEGFRLEGLRDSKKLTAKRREFFYSEIVDRSLAYSISSVSPEEIDRVNIHQASLLAMSRALDGLAMKPDAVMVDGPYKIDSISVEQFPIIGGDDKSHTIAAASVVAKVFRDSIMSRLSEYAPRWFRPPHKGYGTPAHFEEIRLHGITPVHRHSFLKKFHLRVD
ncbi:MAG: Ribonuclease HII [bacterium ADurb.Bin270]|nr:MAG: Ribonuclease HII [bacterium ADurb.Bin270]